MKLSFLLPIALVTSVVIAASGGSGEIKSGHGKKTSIYAYMSARFEGNPSAREVRMLANATLKKYGKPVNKAELFSLGGYLFKVKRQTGLGEIVVLHCVLNADVGVDMQQAVNHCAGFRSNYPIYSL